MTMLLKPSTLIPKGLRVQRINNLTLFKFTDELGDRLQTLLDQKKADALTKEEALELEAIGELDEIFSYINAVIAAKGREEPFIQNARRQWVIGGLHPPNDDPHS